MSPMRRISDEKHDITAYTPMSGRILGEDGSVYNLVDFLLTADFGSANSGIAHAVSNISDWTQFTGHTMSVSPLDIVLYDGVLYQNRTGVITGDAPPDDADNWTVLRGWQGKSAYETAVDNGFTGTSDDWLDTLRTKSPGVFTVSIDDGNLYFIAGDDTRNPFVIEDGNLYYTWEDI